MLAEAESLEGEPVIFDISEARIGDQATNVLIVNLIFSTVVL